MVKYDKCMISGDGHGIWITCS